MGHLDTTETDPLRELRLITSLPHLETCRLVGQIKGVEQRPCPLLDCATIGAPSGQIKRQPLVRKGWAPAIQNAR